MARTAFNGPPGAFASSDQGSTWTRRDALFYSLPIPGSSTVRLLYRPSFSGTSHDVDMLSDDCGASSRELPQSYYACKGVPIQVDSVGRSFLVQSAVNGAVCRSDDAGSSWTQAAAIPDGIKLFGRRGAVLFGYTPATAGFNLVSSSDGGSTWTPSGLQYGIWSVDGFNGDTTVPAYTIAQASNSAELKLWRYDDQAGSWSAVDATLPPGYSLKSMHIAVSPSQHQRLVATTDQAGLLESLDGGKTWKAFAPGVPAGFAFQPFFDPLKPSVLYWAPPGDSSWRIDTER